MDFGFHIVARKGWTGIHSGSASLRCCTYRRRNKDYHRTILKPVQRPSYIPIIIG